MYKQAIHSQPFEFQFFSNVYICKTVFQKIIMPALDHFSHLHQNMKLHLTAYEILFFP